MNDFDNNNYNAPVDPQPQDIPAGDRLPSGSKSKTTAALLGIFLGGIGIHKFYLGYTTPAIIMLCIQLVCLFLGIIGSIFIVGFVFFLGCFAMWIISLIEGIMYLSKSDADFDAVYVVGNKPWF